MKNPYQSDKIKRPEWFILVNPLAYKISRSNLKPYVIRSVIGPVCLPTIFNKVKLNVDGSHNWNSIWAFLLTGCLSEAPVNELDFCFNCCWASHIHDEDPPFRASLGWLVIENCHFQSTNLMVFHFRKCIIIAHLEWCLQNANNEQISDGPHWLQMLNNCFFRFALML